MGERGVERTKLAFGDCIAHEDAAFDMRPVHAETKTGPASLRALEVGIATITHRGV